jgi:glutaredoxin
MDKIKNAKTDYVIISKKNCVFCDMVNELLDDNFIDYTVIKIETLSEDELKEIKPKEAKRYPFIFKNKIYIGSYNELKKELNN